MLIRYWARHTRVGDPVAVIFAWCQKGRNSAALREAEQIVDQRRVGISLEIQL